MTRTDTQPEMSCCARRRSGSRGPSGIPISPPGWATTNSCSLLIHTDLEHATAFAERLIGIISAPYQLGDIGVRISASVGVAGYPVSATDVDTLLKNADHATYKAKGMVKRRACTAESEAGRKGPLGGADAV